MTSFAIYGPRTDLMLFGVGGTLLLCVGLTGLPFSPAVMGALTPAVLVIIGMHYAATYRRAYASWEIVRAHPWVTVAAPLLLAAGAAAAIASPGRVAPLYFLAYMVWSGYHYSRQSFGIAALYPLRQGEPLDPSEKRLLALPLYVSWLLSLVALLQPDVPSRNVVVHYVRWSFPSAVLGHGVLFVAAAALAASLAGYAAMARARGRRGTPLPATSHAVVLAQVVWFGWGVFNPVVAMLVVPLLHSIQYLALTTWHHARGQTGPWLRVLGTYAVTLGLIGWFIQDRPGTWLAGAGVDPLLAAGTVATFVNLHHFLLDGRIWRMRERRVRESFLQSTPAVPSDLSQAA